MKADIALTSPGSIEATLKLTMTLDQFKMLRDGLHGAPFYGPAQELSSAIDQLNAMVRVHFELDDAAKETGHEA